MTISVGSPLPEATFKVMSADGPADMTTAELTSGKKVVLFAVPGAYTPTCSKTHLPGFVTNHDALTAKGFDTIACTSVNDVFVISQWGKDAGADGKVVMLADGSADFAKAVGLEMDLTARGMGMRSQRYAMVIENGIVTALSIEEAPGKAEQSGAEAVLAGL
jgi:peroxiredoxin